MTLRTQTNSDLRARYPLCAPKKTCGTPFVGIQNKLSSGYKIQAMAKTTVKKAVKKTTVKAVRKSSGKATAKSAKPARKTSAKKTATSRVKNVTKSKTGAKPRFTTTRAYNNAQATAYRAICDRLAAEINENLPDAENKIWHGHPVWFLEGNPIVGYSKLKDCIRLLFWSGQSFNEADLATEGSFKAAEKRYTSADQVSTGDLTRWLKKARDIQWDYKNLIRRKGMLERLK